MKTWKHRIDRPVMVELLYRNHAIRWAGWYGDANLVAKWDELTGQFMRGSFGKAGVKAWRAHNAEVADRAHRREAPAKRARKDSMTLDWDELDRWLAEQ